MIIRFGRVPHFLATLVTLALVIVVGTVSAWEDRQPAPPAPTIVRIYYDDIGDLAQLHSYDLFELNNLAERYVLAAVSTAELERLQNEGWRVVSAAAAGPPQIDRDLYFNGYRTVDDLYTELRHLAALYPDLTELVSYGDSACKIQNGCITPGGDETAGYELLAMRVTNENVAGASAAAGGAIERGEKPVLFILANIHARELTTPEIAMRWLSLLLEEYGNDPDVTWLVDWHEMWIIPTANPDGHWITELGTSPPYNGTPFLHRKNFDRDADGDGVVDCNAWPSQSYSHFGVDLNRNHSFGWLAPGNTASACEPTYSGPSEASEPEVAALQELVRALFADRRGPALEDAAPEDTSGMLFTLHNYSELILRPWGFSGEAAPNEADLKAIGDKLGTFNNYLSCRPHECLYFAHGTTDDWAYGELGMPAYTFEIGTSNQGFTPPYVVIDQEQWPENRDAFLYAARIARMPYQLINGPDVSQLTIGEPIYSEDILVTAELDDRHHGGQKIASAEFSIDRPFWDSQAVPHPMLPIGASAENSVRQFYVELDSAGLTSGRHMIFIHGQDIDSTIGVTRSAYFNVSETAHSVWSFLPITAGP